MVQNGDRWGEQRDSGLQVGKPIAEIGAEAEINGVWRRSNHLDLNQSAFMELNVKKFNIQVKCVYEASVFYQQDN